MQKVSRDWGSALFNFGIALTTVANLAMSVKTLADEVEIEVLTTVLHRFAAQPIAREAWIIAVEVLIIAICSAEFMHALRAPVQPKERDEPADA